jgi:hypothetical protein
MLNYSNIFDRKKMRVLGTFGCCLCLLAFQIEAIWATPAIAIPKEAQDSEEHFEEDNNVWEGDQKNFLFRRTNGSDYDKVSEQELKLNRGAFVLEALKPITLDLPQAVVKMKKRAVVYFDLADNMSRIQVLSDKGSHSVEVICNNYRTHLNPGNEAFIAKANTRFGDMLGADNVGRRRVRMHEVGQMKVFLSEFSLLHALERIPLLYVVAHSKTDRDDDLRTRIMKMAAILNTVTYSHGVYARDN